jgi:hypothetical protein
MLTSLFLRLSLSLVNRHPLFPWSSMFSFVGQLPVRQLPSEISAVMSCATILPDFLYMLMWLVA